MYYSPLFQICERHVNKYLCFQLLKYFRVISINKEHKLNVYTTHNNSSLSIAFLWEEKQSCEDQVKLRVHKANGLTKKRMNISTNTHSVNTQHTETKVKQNEP